MLRNSTLDAVKITARINPVLELRGHFDSNITRPITFRLRQLDGIARFLKEHEEDIFQALIKDIGKPRFEALTAEMAVVKGEIDFAKKNLYSWMQPTNTSTLFAAGPAKSHIRPEPYGVVLIISPWNYPLQLSLAPLIGALAAGNTAILKPSELAPATSNLLATCLPEYLDQTCLRVIEGAIPETTALLAEKFDYIFFTGSPNVGRIVMQAAAKNLTPVTLELGGKNPCIVDVDTDLATTAERIVWGKFSNAGQTCVAPDYVLVHEDVEKALLEQMKIKLQEFYGNNPQLSPDYGRIINDTHYERLMQLINGDIYVGGYGVKHARFIAPTILHNVSPTAPIMQPDNEIFGPILPVLKVKSMADAVAFINNRPKPLSVYVFSSDENVINYVSENTSSGSLVANHTLIQCGMPTLPFGGVGPSGMGAYHGKASFDTFSHHKVVLAKSNSPWFGLDPTRLLLPPSSNTYEKAIRYWSGL